MGQKVNPNGFRLGISKKQNANWYAKGKDFSNNLIQDLKVRSHLNTKLKNSSVSKVELERTADTFVVNIHTARPGIIIGKRGEEIENLKKAIEKIVKGPSQINIKEVKKPDLDATFFLIFLRSLVSFNCPVLCFILIPNCSSLTAISSAFNCSRFFFLKSVKTLFIYKSFLMK